MPSVLNTILSHTDLPPDNNINVFQDAYRHLGAQLGVIFELSRKCDKLLRDVPCNRPTS